MEMLRSKAHRFRRMAEIYDLARECGGYVKELYQADNTQHHSHNRTLSGPSNQNGFNHNQDRSFRRANRVTFDS
jgi:hypothetical protein